MHIPIIMHDFLQYPYTVYEKGLCRISYDVHLRCKTPAEVQTSKISLDWTIFFIYFALEVRAKPTYSKSYPIRKKVTSEKKCLHLHKRFINNAD